MNSDYEYVDPDRIYSDQDGVLFNLLGITDSKLLLVSEAFLTSKRLEELSLRPIPIKSAYSLLDIHRYIFQDVYGWAGETRKVDISYTSPKGPASLKINGRLNHEKVR